ncbi:MAG: hypothetical protein ACI83N_001789, partial [Hydrogenophaga sp.]
MGPAELDAKIGGVSKNTHPCAGVQPTRTQDCMKVRAIG